MLNRTIFHIHAWLGFICSLFLLCVAITGIAFALSAPLLHIETGAFPRFVENRTITNKVDISALVLKAKTQTSSTFIPLGYIGGDAEIETPVEMIYGMSDVPNNGGEVEIVTFDPSTNKPISSFFLDRTITHHIIDFHYTLLLGKLGTIVLALTGLAMAVMAILGLILWYPKKCNVQVLKQKLFHINLKRSFHYIMSRTHSITGCWGAIFIVIWGLTGAFWSRPDWQPQWMIPNTDNPPPSILHSLTTRTCNERVSIAKAVSIALANHPQTHVFESQFPASWQPYHVLYLSNGSDIDRKDGDIRFWISSTCPDLFHSEVNRGSHLIGAINSSVHSGVIFGDFRIAVITFVGVVLLLLSISGLILWWNRYVR